MLANNGVQGELKGRKTLICHSLAGIKYFESAFPGADVKYVGARHHKTRKERFEYLKTKYPILEEFEMGIGLKP